MNIGVPEAIAHFFSNPSFDMIYSEALANSLDAGASRVKIKISTQAFEKPETLRIEIEDNGIGFNKQNFEKFSKLLKKADRQHKGLGRLIYLKYFDNVHVESVFDRTSKREFDFNDDFGDKADATPLETPSESCAKLTFTKFCNTQLKSYDNLSPSKIKERLLKQFLPRLYALKQQGREFQLSIELATEESNPEKDFFSGTETLSLTDLPALQELKIEDKSLDLFQSDFTLLYLVEQNWKEKPITAICVDGRAVELPILKDAVIPSGTNAIFLLQSSFFDSKVDDSRQGLAIDHDDFVIIEQIFTEKVSEILNLNVPAILSRNEETKTKLWSRYPHLAGYFSTASVGLIDEEKSVTKAQEAFFREQKEILSAEELTDAQYKLSLNHATRVLTEYILYRNLIIKKIGTITRENENKIHELIVPMQREFDHKTFFDDIYNNNAWLLDDKYMGYRTILSDKNIKELIEKVSDEKELQSDDLRPDIAFVFSDDIDKVEHPVDVVVVELKKKGLGYLDNTRVIDQIEQRARRLISLYPDKIQRLWFFGVVEFDPELMVTMKEKHWTKIFSSDKVYYKEIDVLPIDRDMRPLREDTVPVSVTLLSLDALYHDAKVRNETFLNILKEGIQRFVKSHDKDAKNV